MSTIRIGTITFDWFPFEPRAFRLARAAVDAGYSVDVVCLRQPHQKRFESEDGINIYRVPMGRSFDRSFFLAIMGWCWFLLLAGITITRLYLKRRYDIIVVHNMPDFLVFAALVPKIFGARILLDVQDASPELMAERTKGKLQRLVIALATWQERLATLFADHVVTIGWTLEELLLQRGVSKDKMTSILNSADPKIFPADRQSSAQTVLHETGTNDDQPFIIIYHGTVDARQGLSTAIRAIVLARRTVPNVRLEVKGFGEASYLKRLAAELDADDAVIFSEPCPVWEVADFISRGHVGIMPYRSGGYMELVLPTKAFEFAWMHLPMIASNTRGIRSLFHPKSIVLCNPSDPQSFAEAIIDLYQHPEKRARLVANAAEDYQAYRWERMARLYQQLLASLGCKRLNNELPPEREEQSAEALAKV